MEKANHKHDKSAERRAAKFVEVLSSEVIDLEKLRALSWLGIPLSNLAEFSPLIELRSVVWKILVEYLPTSKAIQAETLQRKRGEYKELVAMYCTKDGIRADQSEYDIKNYKQILVDVPRTMSDYPLFNNPIIREILVRVLFIWNIRHPASGYVQGINDLCAPFIITYLSDYLHIEAESCAYNKDEFNGLEKESLTEVEADVYWSLCKTIEKTQDIYTAHQPGAHKIMNKMKEIVKRVDTELHEHLEKQNVDFIHFAFRWANCFLMREFALDKVIRMWDTYFSESEDMAVFHVYVCASLLLHLKSELIKKEFPALLIYLQSLPTNKWSTDEIEVLLAKSYQLKGFFHKTKHISE